MANPKKAAEATGEAGQPKQVEVTLAKHHTHKRQRLQPGAKLTVTEDQAAWMKGQGLLGEPEEQANG